MATKWKSFSRSAALKAAMVIIITVCAGIIGAMFGRLIMTGEVKYALEAYVETDYFSTIKHYNEVVTEYNLAVEKAHELEKEIEERGAYLGATIVYQSDYVEVLIKPKGEATYGNCINPLRAYNEVLTGRYYTYYSFTPSGVILGNETNKRIAQFTGEEGFEHITLVFREEYTNKAKADWRLLHELTTNIVTIGGICLLISLTCLIWLAAVSGKTAEEGNELRLGHVCSVFTEIPLLLAAAAGVGLAFFIDAVDFVTRRGDFEGQLSNIDRTYMGLNVLFTALLSAAFMLFVTWLICAVAAKLRNKAFVKGSLILRLLVLIGKGLSRIFKGIYSMVVGEWFYDRKLSHYYLIKKIIFEVIMVILGVAMIVTGTEIPYGNYGDSWIVCGIVIILLMIAYGASTFYDMREYGKLDRMIETTSEGMETKNLLRQSSPYYNEGEKLSSISRGFRETMEEKIRTERLKIDLVTNVSHDLKTPLTSIISYVELLSREENLTPEARDYVNILSQKSERLKNIVSDVFELAKTTSGEVTIEQECLDLNRLILQTAADMDDKIKASGLTVRTVLPENPLYTISDGKRIYRVLQNLIDNALKYSLTGTRIYINLEQVGERARISVKNTSAYEMTFTKEEILERFTRGDKSRTTEGSGLGLSIAQGFTIACGGSFDIALDGDLFKVIIEFPLSEKREKE